MNVFEKLVNAAQNTLDGLTAVERGPEELTPLDGSFAAWGEVAVGASARLLPLQGAGT